MFSPPCAGSSHCNSVASFGNVLSKWSQVHGVLRCVFLLREEQCTTGWLLVVAEFGMLAIACVSEKIPGSILQYLQFPANM